MLSWLALIFLTLFSYSMGMVLAAGKSRPARPGLADLFALLALWAMGIMWRLASGGFWPVLGTAVVTSFACAAGLRRLAGRTDAQGIAGEFASMEPEAESGVAVSGARRLGQRWKRLARRLGDVQARVFLGLFYFAVVTPFALLARSQDALQRQAASRDSLWTERRQAAATLERARRQF